MDCILTPKNANILERILKIIKAPYITVDTTAEPLIQQVSDDKSMISNINLHDGFFVNKRLSNKVVKINKPKLSILKMKILRLSNNDHTVNFEYEFDKYTYRVKSFVYDGSIMRLDFCSHMYTQIDTQIFQEVIKNIEAGPIKFEFEGNSCSVISDGSVITLGFSGFDGVSFTIDSTILKEVLKLNDIFDLFELSIDRELTILNILCKSSDITVSFFIAV